jgi:predicted transcriptional regulator of viral defense system
VIFMASKTLEAWLDSLQAQGRYTFTSAEAIAKSGLTAESVRKALRRLTQHARILRLKEYFFSIVPPEYRTAGAPPPTWFIRELMAAMRQPYYVALLSAAALHGVSHQQPQIFQVMTDRPTRGIRAGRTQVHFYTTKYMSAAATLEMKTPTGAVRISTPETTAVDLVRFAKSAGQLDHVAAVIKELAPQIDARRLLSAVRSVDDVPNTQRLGYVLECVRSKPLAAPLHDWLARRIERWQPLRPGRAVVDAAKNRRWQLLIDEPLEFAA